MIRCSRPAALVVFVVSFFCSGHQVRAAPMHFIDVGQGAATRLVLIRATDDGTLTPVIGQ